MNTLKSHANIFIESSIVTLLWEYLLSMVLWLDLARSTRAFGKVQLSKSFFFFGLFSFSMLVPARLVILA